MTPPNTHVQLTLNQPISHFFSETDHSQGQHQHGSPPYSTPTNRSTFDTPSRSPTRSHIREFTPTPYVPQNTPTTMNSPYGGGYGSPGSSGYGTPGDPPIIVIVCTLTDDCFPCTLVVTTIPPPNLPPIPYHH